MPRQIEQKSTDTFADLIAQTVRQSKGKPSPHKSVSWDVFAFPVLSEMAAALPKIKRLSYDRTLLEIVYATRSITSEEIIGQLTNASFPFDKFWIEGVTPLSGPLAGAHMALSEEERAQIRIGALITADQDKGEFTFSCALEVNTLGLYDYLPPAKQRENNIHILDNKIASTYGISVKVSAEDGIVFDEDRLLSFMFNAEKQMGIIDPSGDKDSSGVIDCVYTIADFLARAFVVLSSERIPNNFKMGKTDEEIKLEKQNQSRKLMGRPPILPASPILIDVTRIDPSFFEEKRPKKIQELLGWTSVRRSKPIMSKHGKIFTRKPHDRRIPSPVDRREVAREIFGSNPNVAIEIEHGRPVQVRTDRPQLNSADC